MVNARQDRAVWIGLFAAAAAAIQMAESLLPHPVPGVRLGFANMLTLVAAHELDLTAGIEVAAIRAVLSSLMMGTFLTPAFYLSLSGALAAALIMGGACRLDSRHRVFSLVGVSLLGAAAHATAQVGVARLILIRHPGVWVFLPPLVLVAIVTGYLTGRGAARACTWLDRHRGHT